jgi:NADH-quinone oxidoreductase subunit D
MVTGLRMNNAYIRPGGVAQDLPPGAIDKIREVVRRSPRASELELLVNENPSSRAGWSASATST